MSYLIGEKKYEDNPNPEAGVGFIIFYPFQYYVYKNIYKHLDNSEFVIDLGAFFPNRQPDQLIEDIVELLRKRGVRYRILYYSDYYYENYLESFFSKYSTLVSVWETGCVLLSCNLEKKKVNLTYGAGKELTQVRISRRMYDLILSYSKRDHKLFSQYTKAKIVGNPKFDDWFDNSLDNKFLEKLGSQLSKNRKTVLYLPTHGDLCSIKQLKEELGKLAPLYNIIAKIHYFTIREEPELMEKLKNHGVMIYEDDVDLLPLLKVADVVLSDNSSAIFDAILADRPVVVTDFLSKNYLDVEHKRPRFSRRGFVGPLTYSGSIEQEIKRKGLVISIKSPRDLEISLESAMQDDPFYRKARKQIRDEVFAYHDGECGKRAAKAILEESRKEKNQDHPIMFHAVESFLLENYQNSRSLLYLAAVQQKVRMYENLILKDCDAQGIIFSVILIDMGESPIEPSLRAIFDQKFGRNNYEVIVISRDKKKILEFIDQAKMQMGTLPKVEIIEAENEEKISPKVMEALSVSLGKIICFTKTGYLVFSDWLLKFHSYYKKYPSVAGVGGYTACARENYNLFEEFDDLELAGKIGVWREPRFQERMFDFKNQLFNQNPAGKLANMSYKKETLCKYKDLFNARLLDLVELNLKFNIMKEGELLFAPIKIIRLKEQKFKDFIHGNFHQGFVFLGFSRGRSEIAVHYNISFLTPFKKSILFILDGNIDRKIILTLIIFVGYFYRWLGGVYFRSTLFLNWLRDFVERVDVKQR